MRFSLARTLSAAAIIGALAAIPSFAAAQAVASVCKDGTPSAASGRGACAGHGGVDAQATKAAKAKARADAKAAKAAERAAKAAKKADAKTDQEEAKTERTTRPVHAPTRVSSRARSASAPAAASSGAKDDNDPTNALAQCNDGMYSHASNRRGACSRHGGVKSWLHG